MKKILSLFAAIFMAVSMWAVDIASMTYTKKGAAAPTGWSIAGTAWSSTGNFVYVCSDGSITSPSINWDLYSSVTITATVGRYGTLTGSKATLVATVNGTSIGSVDGTNSTPAAQTYSSFTMPTGTHPIVFTCSNATTTAHGARVTAITITGVPAAGAVNVEGVSLNETSITIIVGKTATLEATVTPANADNKTVSWESDDDEIATVTNGIVRGIAIGSTTVTVTTEDGNKTATCAVNVIAKPTPAGATFYESFDNFDGQGGNDGSWSGTLTMKDWGTNATDNNGWAVEGMMQEASECAGIRKSTAETGGTDKASGLTTPAIGTAGKGRVQFDAESWGTDGSNFYVDIVGEGTFVADANLAAGNISNEGKTAKVALAKTGTFTTFTLSFFGITADSKFRFYAPATKRAFLDEVAIWVSSAAADVPSAFTAGQMKTYSAAYPFHVEGAEVYKAAATATAITLTEITSGDVPAGEGVILYSKAAADATISEIASAAAVANNDLIATTTATTPLVEKPASTVYVLSDDNLFHPYSGAAFVANRAYLLRPAGAEGPVRVIFLEDEVTAVENVEATETVKFMENGQLFIKKNGVIYNAMGQVVK